MLDDSLVKSTREQHHLRKKLEEKRQQQHAKVRPLERLAESLAQPETGETRPWHNIIYALSHSPDGRRELGNMNPDLTGFPLWKSCDEETRARIVRAAPGIRHGTRRGSRIRRQRRLV